MPGGATVTEGNAGTQNVTVPVTLSAASTQPVSVNWSTLAYTATTPADFTGTSGTVTFAPGETAKSVSITGRGRHDRGT